MKEWMSKNRTYVFRNFVQVWSHTCNLFNEVNKAIKTDVFIVSCAINWFIVHVCWIILSLRKWTVKILLFAYSITGPKTILKYSYDRTFRLKFVFHGYFCCVKIIIYISIGGHMAPVVVNGKISEVSVQKAEHFLGKGLNTDNILRLCNYMKYLHKSGSNLVM